MTGVVPNGYEAYVRVLHPVGFEGDRVLRWRDVAQVTGRQVHPLVQWWRLIGASESWNPSSTLWDGDDPATGALHQPDGQVLADLLTRHTTTPDDAYFALWEGSGHFNDANGVMFGAGHLTTAGSDVVARLVAGPRLRHPGRDYLLLAGALSEASGIAELVDARPWALSGNLVWPADRAWCIGTEVDFDSTLVGCSRAAAADLLSCGELETLPIGPDDALHADGDRINRFDP